jgi:hypothetical protein
MRRCLFQSSSLQPVACSLFFQSSARRQRCSLCPLCLCGLTVHRSSSLEPAACSLTTPASPLVSPPVARSPGLPVARLRRIGVYRWLPVFLSRGRPSLKAHALFSHVARSPCPPVSRSFSSAPAFSSLSISVSISSLGHTAFLSLVGRTFLSATLRRCLPRRSLFPPAAAGRIPASPNASNAFTIAS